MRCPLKCFESITYHSTFHCECLKLCQCPPTPRWAAHRTNQARHPSIRPVSTNFSSICIADERPDHPITTSDQPLQGESNFGDSSGPLFSIYSKAADDEDNKMVERWQKDADGILIFVSLRVGIRLSLNINRSTIDRSILCRSRCTPCRDSPGPQAEQSGYLRIPSW